jgi:hypothetical protein
MHSGVAEERNAAIGGEQAPAGQVTNAGIHRSPRPHFCGETILSDPYVAGNPDSGAISLKARHWRRLREHATARRFPIG